MKQPTLVASSGTLELQYCWLLRLDLASTMVGYEHAIGSFLNPTGNRRLACFSWIRPSDLEVTRSDAILAFNLAIPLLDGVLVWLGIGNPPATHQP